VQRKYHSEDIEYIFIEKSLRIKYGQGVRFRTRVSMKESKKISRKRRYKKIIEDCISTNTEPKCDMVANL
jgi:hypothetical protein